MPCLQKGVDDCPAGSGIQISGGFVGEDQQGIVDERPCHGSALFLPAGDLCRIFVPDGVDPEEFQEPVRIFLSV